LEPKEFINFYHIKSLVCCFSGGKDSLVATHYVLKALEKINIEKYVVFVDTTVMIPIVYDFVKNVCKQFGWPLKILIPKESFWNLAGKWGTPTMHSRWCCYHLKLEPIINFVKTLKPQRAEVTGLRKEESPKRARFIQIIYNKKARSWKYAPILNWSGKDIDNYIKKHKLPMPKHYRLGIKETCLCGVFSSKREMQIVRGRFPNFFRKFVDLEDKLKKRKATFYFNNKPCYAKDLIKQKTLNNFNKNM